MLILLFFSALCLLYKVRKWKLFNSSTKYCNCSTATEDHTVKCAHVTDKSHYLGYDDNTDNIFILSGMWKYNSKPFFHCWRIMRLQFTPVIITVVLSRYLNKWERKNDWSYFFGITQWHLQNENVAGKQVLDLCWWEGQVRSAGEATENQLLFDDSAGIARK